MCRYHVRICTWSCQPHFALPETTIAVLEQLLQRLTEFGFSLHAYCFMPDHVHLLLEANRPKADAIALISRWKQVTGFRFKQSRGLRLWQPGFFDRVLREQESSRGVAAYIVANPVRAGIAKSVGEYPFAWCEWGNDVGAQTRG
jgi:putative transposase